MSEKTEKASALDLVEDDGFHALVGIGEKEKQAANTREFWGDGTPFLKVPGLKNVTGVRVGTQVVPLSITEKFPTDATLKEFEDRTTELVRLTTSPDGENILLRHRRSNGGIWQNNERVFVAGEWEKAEKAPKPTAPTGGEGA